MQNHSETELECNASVYSMPAIGEMQPIMLGLAPAFRDSSTGEIHLSRDQNGEITTDHTFFHLPKHWIRQSNSEGEPMILVPTIEAGYWRPDHFIAVTKHLRLPLDS